MLYLGSLIQFRSRMCGCCAVVQSCPSLCRPRGLHHARLTCPSLFRGVCSNSRSLSRWCHPAISSSVVPFSCPQSFPASGSLPKSRLFASGGQNIGASASILPMNNQDWFPLELTGWISLQSKGLSRVFSSATVWKHQFFSTQPSLWFNYHIHRWLLENHSFDYPIEDFIFKQEKKKTK